MTWRELEWAIAGMHEGLKDRKIQVAIDDCVSATDDQFYSLKSVEPALNLQPTNREDFQQGEFCLVIGEK